MTILITLDFLDKKRSPEKLKDIILKLGDITKEALIKHLANIDEFELLNWVSNVKNYVGGNDFIGASLPTEIAQERGKKGGHASGEAKRQKKTINTALECLELYINNKDKQYTDNIEELSFIENCPPEIRLLGSVLLDTTAEIKDKLKASEIILAYKYGKPLQKQEIKSVNINSITLTDLFTKKPRDVN